MQSCKLIRCSMGSTSISLSIIPARWGLNLQLWSGWIFNAIEVKRWHMTQKMKRTELGTFYLLKCLDSSLSFLRTFCGQGCKLEFDGEVQDLFQYDCRYGYLVWSPFFLFSLIWLVFMLLYQYDSRYGYLVWSLFFLFSLIWLVFMAWKARIWQKLEKVYIYI